MPFNLAVLGADKAGEIINAPPGFYATWSALLTQVESSAVKRWVIGGHSLGGAMAAQYSYKNPGSVKGLALWAAYPAGNNDLSGQDIAVISIYGNRDGVAAPDKVLAAKTLLPRTTRWVEINGGNHSQFGWYGLQPGDNEAGITRENQQSQVVKATVELLQQVEKGW
jgi:pimeloyl-ACP methyl ester carboxylesterase